MYIPDSTVLSPSPVFYAYIIRDDPFYGGPQEGGWWGSDSSVVVQRCCATAAEAKAAAENFQEEVNAKNKEEKASFYRSCRESCDAAEARGQDASDLPELDGESTYHVGWGNEAPENSRGSRRYE